MQQSFGVLAAGELVITISHETVGGYGRRWVTVGQLAGYRLLRLWTCAPVLNQ